MTDYHKILDLLAADNPVRDRLASGHLRVDIGPATWPDGWYIDPYWRVSVPLVLDLAEALPAVETFAISYHRDSDFHRINFSCDGDDYVIEWYKVFRVTRKSDGKTALFGGDRHYVANWFRSGKYLSDSRWERGFKHFDPFA